MKVNIEVDMNERWLKKFLAMLYHMEKCGIKGKCSLAAFYVDGDGDFRPKFNVNNESILKDNSLEREIDYNEDNGISEENGFYIDAFFDAG